jgi:hypothetical protein
VFTHRHFDVSRRQRTQASVEWRIKDDWYFQEVSVKQKTPNIASVIQEVQTPSIVTVVVIIFTT